MEKSNLKNTTYKAIIEYDLNDSDAEMSLNRSLKSKDMALVLWELSYNMERKIENKLASLKRVDRYKGLDLFYEEFNDLLQEHDINVDNLIN